MKSVRSLSLENRNRKAQLRRRLVDFRRGLRKANPQNKVDFVYRALSLPPLLREQSRIRAGQAAFLRDVDEQGKSRYNLRRRVHMIEKGLVMRPRRDVFATAYIERAVDLLVGLCDTVESCSHQDEVMWFWSVFDEYFSVVNPGLSEAVDRARLKFEEWGGGFKAQSGIDTRFVPSQMSRRARSGISPLDLEELFRQRASVRWFVRGEVPRHLVDRAVTDALEAPSACNRQPYRFLLIEDPDVVERVASIPGGTNGYANGVRSIAVLLGDMSAFEEERDRHVIYIDSSLAAMQFILSLESRGVSTCCINWPDIRSKESAIRGVLPIRHHEAVIMLIAYGYADPDGSVPASVKKGLDQARLYI